MSELQIIGPQWGTNGNPKPFTAGISGNSRTSDAHGRFLDAVLGNRAFSLSVAAAAPTAYVGAAGGSPLIAVHNPAGSNKILFALLVTNAMRAAATVAGETGLVLWSGPSVAPTGTQTAPTNTLSLAKSGSAALGFVNTALTSSTALALAAALSTYYWATAAAALMAPGMFDIGGIVCAIPGNQIALGLTTAPTSLTVDASLFWEEVPYTPIG